MRALSFRWLAARSAQPRPTITLRGKITAIGIVVILVQVFVWLAALDASPVFGVPLSGYQNLMAFYMVLEGILGFMVLAMLPASQAHESLQTGTISGFVFSYSVTGILAWLTMTLAFIALGVRFAPVPDTTRLQELIFYAGFVSCGEEIVFRASLPAAFDRVLHLPPFMAYSLTFAAFHIPVDVLSGGASPAFLASAFLQRALAGLVLYGIYRLAGLAAAIQAHFSYDSALLGILGQYPISLHSAGLALI